MMLLKTVLAELSKIIVSFTCYSVSMVFIPLFYYLYQQFYSKFRLYYHK